MLPALSLFVPFPLCPNAEQVFADGVGSVTFDSPNDAQTAANRMNGYVVEGMQLRVRVEG